VLRAALYIGAQRHRSAVPVKAPRRTEIVVQPVFSPRTSEQKILPPLFFDFALPLFPLLSSRSSLPAPCFSLPASRFQLPASRFRLPFLVAVLRTSITTCYAIAGEKNNSSWFYRYARSSEQKKPPSREPCLIPSCVQVDVA